MKNTKIRGITADICIEDDKDIDFELTYKALDDALLDIIKYSKLNKKSIKIYICA